MLPKHSRLNLKTDFKWTASGKRLETKLLVLFIKEGENQEPKIGIALSSKTFRKAHDRNRAKRLVSAAFESLISKLNRNINIVALPKSNILEVKSTQVLEELEAVLKKGFLNNF